MSTFYWIGIDCIKPKYFKKYEPYYIVSGEWYDARVDITREENNLQALIENHEIPGGYEEGSTEASHSEILKPDTLERLIIMEDAENRKRLYVLLAEALEQLTPTQKRRIIARYYENKSSRKIAEEEGVNYSKVYKSID